MGKKVESYQSDDGKLFKTEEAMLLHEAQIALTEEFPTLKINVPFIMENAERISALLELLASYYAKNHPAVVPETTLTTLRAACEAVQKSDSMVCMNCDQAWDMNDPFPPACKPPVAEDRGGCDCSASLAGNGGPHHPTCPMWRGGLDA